MNHSPHFSRRDFLSRSGMGIGSLAFLDLMSREASAAGNPLGPAGAHLVPRARAVIQRISPCIQSLNFSKAD
jgi:hypothetical protein